MDPLDYVRSAWIYLADHPVAVFVATVVVGLLAFRLHWAIYRQGAGK